ncbi:polysaccharide pyruvyl transferase family protein [Limnospira fusiformis]|uniref:polysaccharide pyruvyl transferase family protein n=1 Tax=Limnospira fusiformis TaxID=54297 RepID=UPI0014491F6A|nr:polysaccharide pyruvyl transferase family protein [Limnospira fusiformis SAG 85.79]
MQNQEQKPMNILLIGYYGQRNIGDDLFVKQLTNYFSCQSNVGKVFVLCKEDYYPKISEKVIYFSESNLPKLKKLGLILRSDYIFWGGGTLNIGSSPPKNLLRLKTLSKLMGKGFGFLGVGLEGSNSESYQLFDKCYLLYLRDKYSYELALNNFKNTQFICLGGDLAFLELSFYEPFIATKNRSEFKNISFSGKYWWGEGRGEFYAKQLIPVIEKYNSVIHLLPSHVGDETNDNRFHEFLRKYLPEKNCQLHSWQEPQEFIKILSEMDFHLGNRLHSIIIADILGVPNIGIQKSGSKIDNYLQKTGVLPQERRVDVLGEIGLDRMEKIFNQYQRPDAFIKNESEQVKKCLEIIGQ